jgi:hypothetical protein
MKTEQSSTQVTTERKKAKYQPYTHELPGSRRHAYLCKILPLHHQLYADPQSSSHKFPAHSRRGSEVQYL